MKLDRNTNPDGRGKYALINLRKNTVEWGGPPEAQFFVIKYKDRFAEAALRAYAAAAYKHASDMRANAKNGGDIKDADELMEFADDIISEAEKCRLIPFKQRPS